MATKGQKQLLKKCRRILDTLVERGGRARMSDVQEGLARGDGFKDWNAAYAAAGHAGEGQSGSPAGTGRNLDLVRLGDRMGEILHGLVEKTFTLEAIDVFHNGADRGLTFSASPRETKELVDELGGIMSELSGIHAEGDSRELRGMLLDAATVAQALVGHDNRIHHSNLLDAHFNLNRSLFVVKRATGAAMAELHFCGDCGMRYERGDRMTEVSGHAQPSEPDRPAPSGGCRVCGALCYPDTDWPDGTVIPDACQADSGEQLLSLGREVDATCVELMLLAGTHRPLGEIARGVSDFKLDVQGKCSRLIDTVAECNDRLDRLDSTGHKRLGDAIRACLATFWHVGVRDDVMASALMAAWRGLNSQLFRLIQADFECYTCGIRLTSETVIENLCPLCAQPPDKALVSIDPRDTDIDETRAAISTLRRMATTPPEVIRAKYAQYDATFGRDR